MKLNIKHRIIYYIFISMLFLFASYALFQKVLISKKIKNVIITRLNPILKAQVFNISEIDMDFKYININNIKYQKDNLKLEVDNIRLAYSPFNLLQKGINFKSLIDKVWIADISLEVDVSQESDSTSGWSVDVDQYKNLIRKVEDFEYLDSITIRNFSSSIVLPSKIHFEILHNFTGLGVFDRENNNIDLDLHGKLYGSNTDNTSLYGKINYQKIMASLELDIKSSLFHIPFFLKNKVDFNRGRYSGKFEAFFNYYNKGGLDLTGNLILEKLRGKIAGINLEKLSLEMLFNNGAITLKNLDLELYGNHLNCDGILYSPILDFPDLKGKIDTIVIPESISENLILKEPVLNFKIKKNRDYKYNKDFSLFQNITSIVKFESDFYIKDIKYNQYLLSDFYSQINIIDNHFYLDSGSVEFKKMFFDFNVSSDFHKKINITLQNKGQINKLFKNSASFLTKELPYSCKIFAELPIDKGIDIHKLFGTGKIVIDDEDFDLGYKNKKLWMQKLDNKKLFDFILDLQQSLNFTFKSSNLTDLLSCFIDIDGLGIANSILQNNINSIKIFGNKSIQHCELKIKSLLDKSFYSGELFAIIQHFKNSSKLEFNFLPDSLNYLKQGLKAQLLFDDKKIKLNNVKIGKNNLLFDFVYWKKPELFQAKIDWENININNLIKTSFIPNLKLSSNSSLIGEIKGSKNDYQGFLNFIEKDLKFMSNDTTFENIKPDILKGKIKLSFNHNKIISKEFRFTRGKRTVLNLVGIVSDFNNYNFSSYGKWKIDKLKDFLFFKSFDDLKGNISFFCEGKGSFNDFQINTFNLIGDSLKYGVFDVENFEADLNINKTGITINKVSLENKEQLNATIEGFIPFSTTEDMGVRLDFRANLLSYITKTIPYYVFGDSFNEGSIFFKGSYLKPKIDDLNIYFLDGTLTVSNITEKFKNLHGKVYLDKDNFLKVKDLTLNGSNEHRLIVNSRPFEGEFQKIKLPLGINVGIVGVEAPDGGVISRVPGSMKVGEYGLLEPTGYGTPYFLVGMYNKGVSFKGKGLIRNSVITFPLTDEETFPGSPKSKKGEKSIPKFLDIELVPISGNYFYYEGGISKKKTFWEKIKSTFSYKSNNSITNLLVALKASDSGVKLLGNTMDGIKGVGEMGGREGRLSYAGLDFEIEEARVLFDGGFDNNGTQDPFISGSGKTNIRSKTDSTGFANYETIQLKIVSRDKDGEITNSEGARLSSYQILLLDEDGNPWMDKMQGKIENLTSQETANALLNQAIDNRVFAPLLSPVENLLGSFLNAYVSIRPNITENLRSDELSTRVGGDQYVNVFEGSEVYISKFITDNLAISLNSKYIGDENGSNLDEYGFRNNLGFDYRLGKYTYTSIGYEFNTLNDTRGYNLGLKYKYRFKKFSYTMNEFRLFMIRRKEKFLQQFE